MRAVRLLSPPDVPATAAVLAAALADDPAYARVLPGPDRIEGLTRLFAASLRAHLPLRCTWVAEEDNRIAASVTVRPPGWKLGPLALARHGALGFALAHGAAACARLAWLDHTYAPLARAAADPHGWVHLMGVAPARQGGGLGRAVLEAALPRAGVAPVVLTTHHPGAVAFFVGSGFAVVHERAVTLPGSSPYRVWVMRRDPGR